MIILEREGIDATRIQLCSLRWQLRSEEARHAEVWCVMYAIWYFHTFRRSL